MSDSQLFEYVASETFTQSPGIYYFDWSLNVTLNDGALVSLRGAAYADTRPVIYRIHVPLPGFTLGELIQGLGDPDFIGARQDESPDIGGPTTWVINIVWLSQGVVVDTSGSLPYPPRIDDALIFNKSDFFVPSMEGYLKLSETEVYHVVDLKKWEGFADAEKYLSNPE